MVQTAVSVLPEVLPIGLLGDEGTIESAVFFSKLTVISPVAVSCEQRRSHYFCFKQYI